jgi:hypothetical protein
VECCCVVVWCGGLGFLRVPERRRARVGLACRKVLSRGWCESLMFGCFSLLLEGVVVVIDADEAVVACEWEAAWLAAVLGCGALHVAAWEILLLR